MSYDKICTLEATTKYPCQENEYLLMRDAQSAVIDINNNQKAEGGDFDVFKGKFYPISPEQQGRTPVSFTSLSCVTAEQLNNYKACVSSLEPSQTLRSIINTTIVQKQNEAFIVVRLNDYTHSIMHNLKEVGEITAYVGAAILLVYVPLFIMIESPVALVVAFASAGATLVGGIMYAIGKIFGD